LAQGELEALTLPPFYTLASLPRSHGFSELQRQLQL